MKLATICLLQRDNEILMLHRNKRLDDIHYNKYVALGGKINDGESPEHCVEREVFEESGLTISRPVLKGILTFDNQGRIMPNGKPEENWYVFVYFCKDFSGILRDEAKEGTLLWVPTTRLYELNLHEGDKLFLPWIINHPGYFSARFVYEREKLVGHHVIFYP